MCVCVCVRVCVNLGAVGDGGDVWLRQVCEVQVNRVIMGVGDVCAIQFLMFVFMFSLLQMYTRKSLLTVCCFL